MEEQAIFEITNRELALLKDFMKILKEERDSILSFSLEGIVKENNRKEEVLRKIEYLEDERERIMEKVADKGGFKKNPRFRALFVEVETVMKEVNADLERNTRLLSFSMDHVRSSIDNIVKYIDKTTYGVKDRRGEGISLFPSRRV